MGERGWLGNSITWSLLIGAFVLCFGGSLTASRAEARPQVRRANKGLSPGAVIPHWAKRRAVHLLPAAPDASGGSAGRVARGNEGVHGEGAGGKLLGPHNGLEQRENTDRPLLYRGGSGVQHEPHVYAIFWGSKWNESAPSQLRTQLLNMYKGLSGSAFQGILTQYFDGTGRISSTVTVSSYTDTGVTAPTGVEDAKLQQEVAAAIAANGWAGNFDAQFVVIPAPGTSYDPGFGKNFCGYHGLTEQGGYSYTFVPYIGDEPFYPNCIGYGIAPNDVTSMVAAHEYAESATDPALDTWYSEQGFEIADICATQDFQVSGGPLIGSWVQPLWDQSEATCSLEHLEPPRVYAVTEPGESSGWHELGLRGVVNPEGTDTHYRFEYGQTPAYGNSVPVPDVDAGSGSANLPAGRVLSGMPQGIYHYRLVATNSTGTVAGEDRVAVSPGFAPKNIPQPPNSGNGQEAFDVSCVQVDDCIAVGGNWSLDVHTQVPQASIWNGNAWTPMTTPTPPGLENGWLHQRHAVFSAISCASAGFCLAVGNYKGPSEVVEPLAETWDGTGWTLQPTALPAEATRGVFQGASCTSSTACTAVGSFESGSGAEEPLVERWNGTTLTQVSAPSAGGAPAAWLESVSCTSSTACTAVGSYENEEGEEATLAERWNGSEWLLQSTVDPPGAFAWNWLRDVSCASSSDCMAVGTHYEKIGTRFTGSPLIERWDGTKWSLEASQNPQPNNNSALSGVSCVSPGSCTAVGSYSNLSASDSWTEPFAERWSGSDWSLLGMPDPPVPPESWHERWVNGVSCVEATACVAVGDGLSAPFGSLASYRAFSENEFLSPFASFVVTTAAPVAGLPVDFDATSSDSLNSSIESYEWDFGDGSGGSGPTPSHTYAHSGGYTVTLTVSDGEGETGQVSHSVEVSEPPIVDPPPPPPPPRPPHVAEPPETVVFGYRVRARRHTVSFRFGSATPGVEFRCKLDLHPFASCVSPEVYRHLIPGRHTFRVVAQDVAGNQDPTPVVIHFKVPRVKQAAKHRR